MDYATDNILHMTAIMVKQNAEVTFKLIWQEKFLVENNRILVLATISVELTYPMMKDVMWKVMVANMIPSLNNNKKEEARDNIELYIQIKLLIF